MYKSYWQSLSTFELMDVLIMQDPYLIVKQLLIWKEKYSYSWLTAFQVAATVNNSVERGELPMLTQIMNVISRILQVWVSSVCKTGG